MFGSRKPQKHEFWESQPVPQLPDPNTESKSKTTHNNSSDNDRKNVDRNDITTGVTAAGPFQKLTAENQPLPIPDHIEWCSWTPEQCQDVNSPMIEEVHHLTTVTDSWTWIYSNKRVIRMVFKNAWTSI